MNEISSSQFADIVRVTLSECGKMTFSPNGTSMLPTISDSDDVILSPARKLKKYDIALYLRKNGNVILHRVIGKNGSGYIMRGDAQWQTEYAVTDSDVLAVVCAYRKNGKCTYAGSPRFILNAVCINLRNEIRRFFHRVYIKLRAFSAIKNRH